MLQVWLAVIVIGGGGILLVFFLFGDIGPQWLRDRMRRMTKWLSYDARPFFPIDPYKPFPDALKESVDNALPTGERWKNWALVQLVSIAIGAILVLALILLSLAK